MKAQIVSFHCVLKDTFGKVLSSSFNQDVINQLEGAPSSVDDRRLRGLVAGIQNVRKGEGNSPFQRAKPLVFMTPTWF